MFKLIKRETRKRYIYIYDIRIISDSIVFRNAIAIYLYLVSFLVEDRKCYHAFTATETLT